MENFNSFGLSEVVLHSLKTMQFHTPTPIQAQTIPPALQGHDVLGTAQTGTGKTAAYGIPLVSYLLNNPHKTALVLTPTRELALQVLNILSALLGKKSPIQATLLIGGKPMPIQLRQLKNKPRLIVGTPGRVNDHLIRGSLKLNSTEFLVLDETDRMLDMGFSMQIENIIRYLPEQRQTLMFSATMAKEIVKTAEKYLNNAIRISIGSTTNPIEKIKQEAVHTSESQKFSVLLEHLNQIDGSCIIFVKTKMGTERLANQLCNNGHTADAIHGDLRQRAREKTLKDFRNGTNSILVATDVAARGLDIPHIESVVNYDLPQCPEDYIHRIGRTGRAGAEGVAINLIAPHDKLKWKDICRLMNPNDKTDSFQEHRNPRGKTNNRRNGRGEKEFKSFSSAKHSKPFESRQSRFQGKNITGRKNDFEFERSEHTNGRHSESSTSHAAGREKAAAFPWSSSRGPSTGPRKTLNGSGSRGQAGIKAGGARRFSKDSQDTNPISRRSRDQDFTFEQKDTSRTKTRFGEKTVENRSRNSQSQEKKFPWGGPKGPKPSTGFRAQKPKSTNHFKYK